jgi:hypothetical protein
VGEAGWSGAGLLGETRETLADLAHGGLELGVGVLPLLHEMGVALDGFASAGREVVDRRLLLGKDGESAEKLEAEGPKCQPEAVFRPHPPIPTSSAQRSGSRLAPPTSTPSSSGRASSDSTLAVLTLPP